MEQACPKCSNALSNAIKYCLMAFLLHFLPSYICYFSSCLFFV
jgi:hypothetical protein